MAQKLSGRGWGDVWSLSFDTERAVARKNDTLAHFDLDRWEMEEVMDGPSWAATWPLIHLDDVVQLRTSATVGNKVSKYGQYGELFFFLMQKEPYGYFRDFVSLPLGRHKFMLGLKRESSRRLRDNEFDHDSEFAWSRIGKM